jgi:hypothetical protein
MHKAHDHDRHRHGKRESVPRSAVYRGCKNKFDNSEMTRAPNPGKNAEPPVNNTRRTNNGRTSLAH